MDDFASVDIQLPSFSQMLETCYTMEPPFVSYQQESLLFKEEGEKVYLLGKEFSEKDGVEKVKEYVTSRLWFTYRRNFSPIGGTGPESDQGWGCMLRCAQMLLGETLIRRHIGKHFVWNRKETPHGDYEKILQLFLDEKTALYSIHQIAQMGVSEGKAVGEWFGPNTAAQVLKKLSVFDLWSNVAVHVALDNILISRDVTTMATLSPTMDAVKLISADGYVDESHLSLLNDSVLSDEETPAWRPLLLVVPLRLGLTTINRCYLPAIQEYFKLDSCVGIVGGRPNHALYFIGIAGERLLYLDPHYCRPTLARTATVPNDNEFMDIEQIEMQEALEARASVSLSPDGESVIDDTTFHCEMMLSMEYDQVDPSLALAFFCESSDAYKQLIRDLNERVFPASKPALFEHLEKRPKYWPPFEPYTGVKARIEMTEFDDMTGQNVDVDDGFEVLEDEFSFGNEDEEKVPESSSDSSLDKVE